MSALSTRLRGRLLPRILPLLLVGALVAAALPGTVATAQESKSKTFIVYHVFGTDAEKEEIPKALKPFRSRLLRTLKKKFTLNGTRELKLEVAKPITLALPSKLGSATVTLQKDGQVKVQLLSPKKKNLGKVVSGRYPVVIVQEKLKVAEKQYILILTKKKKSAG